VDARDVVLGFLHEVWDQGRVERALNYIHEDYDLGPLGRGPRAAEANRVTFSDAFPDLRLDVEDVIASGPHVAVWMRLSATHGGTFRGYAATGRHATWDEVGFFTVQDGKIIRGRYLADMFGLRKALGVLPTDMA
jgi:ketosteroid isomerase-like protein